METITLKQVYEKVIELDVRMTMSSEGHREAFKELKVFIWWISIMVFFDIVLSVLNLYIHFIK